MSENIEQKFIHYLDELEKKLLATFRREGHPYHLRHQDAALVIIDMQEHYCCMGESAAYNLKRIIEQTNQISAAARAANIPVIWVRMNFTATDSGNDTGLYLTLNPNRSIKGITNQSESSKIFSGMVFDETDHQVFKNRYSAMINPQSELNQLLKHLGKKQLIVTGIASNVCVESTVRDAMQLDYEVLLVEDACSTSNPVVHRFSMLNLKTLFADIYSTAEILEQLRGGTN